VLTNGDAPGDGTATFAIFKLVATDITAGMISSHKILTLRDTDNDLNAFALPATTDVTGADAYGKDGFYFNKAAARAAVRGGYFVRISGAGVFYLDLLYVPSASNSSIGFRAAKSVNAPSSGATIVSAKGGATANFAYKNASFTYNAASYNIKLTKILKSRIADGSILAGNNRDATEY